jgi:hypothetical protein
MTRGDVLHNMCVIIQDVMMRYITCVMLSEHVRHVAGHVVMRYITCVMLLDSGDALHNMRHVAGHVAMRYITCIMLQDTWRCVT